MPPTASPCCRQRSRPGSRSRPGWRRAGTACSATPDALCPWSTTAPPPTTRPSSASSASPPRPSSRQTANRSPTPTRFSKERSMSNKNTQALSDAGVSIWLDDLSRDRITSGALQTLMKEDNVVGVTTNPTIFAAALKDSNAYAAQVRHLVARDADVQDAVFAITTEDVSEACDLFAEIALATDGVDGRVSIEVDPRLARDAAGTVYEAKHLAEVINRPNVFIKIPATKEGLEAITATLAAGISVNVTLIFSLERYRAVINAFMSGLEQAKENGHNLAEIHSVASFFVSRVDTEIDKRLDALGTDEALALKGKAGVANARLAYQIWEEQFDTERWQVLAAAGARPQRPLWASTGVKDPAYPDTLYVTG